MKPSVHLHPDGLIRVCDTDTQYIGTHEEFQRDWHRTPPAFPPDCDEVIYEPDVRHTYIKDNSVIDGGPMPWPEGDLLLADLDSVMQAMQAQKAARDKQAEDARKAEHERWQKIVADTKAEHERQEQEAKIVAGRIKPDDKTMREAGDRAKAEVVRHNEEMQQRVAQGEAEVERERARPKPPPQPLLDKPPHSH